MSKNDQIIENHGNMINSTGDHANNSMVTTTNLEKFDLAKKQIKELEISDEEKTDALDMLDVAKENFGKGFFDKTLRFINKIPDIAKAVPAIKLIIDAVSSIQ